MLENYVIPRLLFLRRCILIKPELSRQQRHTQWELRRELARRKKEGETGIFIRRGRIVKQSRSNDHLSSAEMDHQNA